jgi:hypothetical protein
MLPLVQNPKRGRVREAYMNPNPGNDNSYLGAESGVRHAAMVVIDELGENAAAYATTRAIVLQKQGDEIGASAWRRVAPVIEELQRKRAAGSS